MPVLKVNPSGAEGVKFNFLICVKLDQQCFLIKAKYFKGLLCEHS